MAALWDLHHPFRFGGETPEQTVQNLGAFIKYTHIKDSVLQDGKVVYKMMGDGDLPMEDIMRVLRSINYEGYITLEWVKYYAPDMAEAGVVFPQFAHYMSRWSGHEVGSERLQTNNRGDGQYIWPKEHLIDLTFRVLLRVIRIRCQF